MMSFTGSTRAGIAVSKAAADTVKRVALELGGKSANIVLDDADLGKAVQAQMGGLMVNSGQSCNAPTRMFVPRKKQDEIAGMVKAGDGGHQDRRRLAAARSARWSAKRSTTRSRA